MAFERLDATQRKHEGARGVRPVGTERAIDREPRARVDLARSGEANFLLESAADKRVTNEDQTLAQRHADAVRKFDRRRARAPLGAVDDDIIEKDAGLDQDRTSVV